MIVLHFCFARGNYRFTCESIERPFRTQRSYGNIVLSTKIKSVRPVRDDLIKRSYYQQKDEALVSVCVDLMQDLTVLKRTDRPFLYAKI